MRLRLVVGALILMLAAGPVRAQDAPPSEIVLPGGPLNEKLLTLRGDPRRPVTEEVTLFTPSGPGPHPLAVMNHGADHASNGHRGERYRYTYSAYYFLSRGYAVALPMARGFAGSGGEIVGRGCDLEAVGLDNARDLRAVIGQLRQLPGIDPDRVVVAGQSFGGWTTLALGTMDVPGVRGLVAFMPTLRASDCDKDDAAMIRAADDFGASARLPSLWFFGDNDSLNPSATWRAMFRLYTGAGGRADLVPVGEFMQDSHQLLSYPESLPIWTTRVDGFLARIGLPSAEVHPEYMPVLFPKPSHFAEIENAAAVPFVAPAGRVAYEKFLSEKPPRVFAIAPDGSFSATQGGFDPLGRALKACAKIGRVCEPYAVDSDVVWSPVPVPVTTMQHTVAAGTEAALHFAFAMGPDCQSRPPPEITVTLRPLHGVLIMRDRQGHPHFPADNKLAGCNTTTTTERSLSYVPSAGYAGADEVGFQEAMPDGAHRAYRVELTVK